MSVIYGAQPFNFDKNEANLNYDVVGKNSEAFTQYDPVTYSSGQLVVAGTTNAVTGIVNADATMASTNASASGAQVKPGYIPVDETTPFLMGCNADLTGNFTDPGTYYKLTANTTGTVQIDVANGTLANSDAVVMIKQVDPYGIGGTGAGSGLRQAVVVFVKRTTEGP